MSELALKLIAKEKEERTGSLDLGNCGLTELPKELFELGHLKELIVSNRRYNLKDDRWIQSSNRGVSNKITYSQDNFIRLKNLKKLIIGADTLHWGSRGIGNSKRLMRSKQRTKSLPLIQDFSFLEKMTSLETLSLNSNQITDIKFLEKLINLQFLDLSDNPIKDYNALKKLTSLRTLNLNSNTIRDIRFFDELLCLKSLGLSFTKIDDIHFLEKLTTLEVLNLTANNISDVRFLEKLENLRILYLGKNKIRDVHSLKKLKQLKYLYVHDNQLEKIYFLKKMKKLEQLNISSNPISDYSIIKELTGLQILTLNSNKISNIIFLKNLTNLRILDLHGNRISDICYLEKLTNLIYLDLSDNHISNYHHIRKLNKLLFLDLGYNKIKSTLFLENTNNLRQLLLNNNRIHDISSLGKLHRLQVLDLSYNGIKDISPLKMLVQNSLLKGLNISNNKIENLSPILPLIERRRLIQLDFEETDSSLAGIEYVVEGILVNNNPLIAPPLEITKEGNDAVLEYFRDIESQGVDYLYEAKLLIVGEGESGKTTLAWKLKDIGAPMPKKGEDRTWGIDIQALKIQNNIDESKPFHMNVWDFGGQEIYHATHQFFLTKRSLYLIVNNTRSNLTDFNHWVQTINLFSDNSPILIVQNEVADSVTDFDLRGIQQYFANVLGLKDSDLSNIEDGRLQKLIREIHHQIQQLDHVGMELPKQWVAIRKDLEVEAKEKHFISNKEFFRICEQNEIVEREAIQRIGDLFHDLGVLLYFQEDPILRKLVILKNSWVTKGVYAILDNTKIREQKGRFSFVDADQIWEGTVFEGKETELLQLMMKFDLCYCIPFHEPTLYVLPQLLPKEKPVYEWDNYQNLILYYRYEFMPKGLLGRLIVRLHRYIKDIDQYAWLTGCIFTYENTDAQVIETYGASRIEIRINGKHRSRIATIVTKEIDELNGSFERIEVEKLVPCNCSRCKNNSTPHFFEYEGLMTRKEKGKSSVECYLSYEDVHVQEILDGIFESIPEQDKSIADLIRQDKIKDAIGLLESTHPKEAILLHQRLIAAKRYFALGMSTSEEWSVIRQQISYSVLAVFEMPSSEGAQVGISIGKISAQLNSIEDKLSNQDQLLNQIVSQNGHHQQELIEAFQSFRNDPPDEAYINELVAVIERGMADLQAKAPQAKDILNAWKEASQQAKLTTDSKVKLKLVSPFPFLKVEKELNWDGKKLFAEIREDIRHGRKGSWTEMFVR